MPYFEQAEGSNFFQSSFVDVKGDFHYYAGESKPDRPDSDPSYDFAEFDRLYARILSASSDTDLVRCILGCVLLPIDGHSKGVSISMTAILLGRTSGEIKLTLRGMDSLFAFEEANFPFPDTYIVSLDDSLAAFAFNEKRAGAFFINAQEHHALMALASWKYLANWQDTGFDNNPEPAGRYVFRNFRFHFNVVLDKHRLLENLEIINTKWKRAVDASSTWPITEKHALLEVVELVLEALQAIGPPPEDRRIQQLTELVDFIFSMHLSPQSEEDFQFIQGIFAAYCLTRDGVKIGTAQEVAEFLQLSSESSIAPFWQDIHDYMTTWNPAGRVLGFPGPLCHRLSFVDHMSDRARCGDLFIDSAIWHAHLAICCMEHLLASGPLVTLASWSYVRDCLPTHLLMSSRCEERILDYLRSLDLALMFYLVCTGATHDGLTVFGSQVVTWLQSISDPPRDVLLPLLLIQWGVQQSMDLG